jgi:hypothetical protein
LNDTSDFFVCISIFHTGHGTEGAVSISGETPPLYIQFVQLLMMSSLISYFFYKDKGIKSTFISLANVYNNFNSSFSLFDHMNPNNVRFSASFKHYSILLIFHNNSIVCMIDRERGKGIAHD